MATGTASGSTMRRGFGFITQDGGGGECLLRSHCHPVRGLPHPGGGAEARLTSLAARRGCRRRTSSPFIFGTPQTFHRGRARTSRGTGPGGAGLLLSRWERPGRVRGVQRAPSPWGGGAFSLWTSPRAAPCPAAGRGRRQDSPAAPVGLEEIDFQSAQASTTGSATMWVKPEKGRNSNCCRPARNSAFTSSSERDVPS